MSSEEFTRAQVRREDVLRRFDYWFNEVKELGGTAPGVPAAALLVLAELLKEAMEEEKDEL